MAEHDGVRAISDARRAAGDADPELIDSEYWARLTHAQDAASFTASWLDAQCRALGGVIRGAVVLRTSEAATSHPSLSGPKASRAARSSPRWWKRRWRSSGSPSRARST